MSERLNYGKASEVIPEAARRAASLSKLEGWDVGITEKSAAATLRRLLNDVASNEDSFGTSTGGFYVEKQFDGVGELMSFNIWFSLGSVDCDEVND